MTVFSFKNAFCALVLLGASMMSSAAFPDDAVPHPPQPTPSGENHVLYLHAPADMGMTIRKTTPACPIDSIVLAIGGIKLKIPREGLEYVTESQKEQWGVVNKADKLCDVTYVPDVSRLSTYTPVGKWFNLAKVSKAAFDSNTGRPYASWQFRLKRWGEDILMTLPSGVKKLSHNQLEMYLFPLEQAATANGEPVVFDCTGNAAKPYPAEFCNVSYLHPDGLAFGYRFFRQDVPESQYLEYDRHLRQLYEQMKVTPSAISAPKGGAP